MRVCGIKLNGPGHAPDVTLGCEPGSGFGYSITARRKAVWDQKGDICDVISIGKLVRNSDGTVEVDQNLVR
jgi:hypothetical protein